MSTYLLAGATLLFSLGAACAKTDGERPAATHSRLVSAAPSPFSAARAPRSSPSVVLAIAGDMGYGDMGHGNLSGHGNPTLRTPRRNRRAGRPLAPAERARGKRGNSPLVEDLTSTRAALAMVENIDDIVGRLLDALDSLGAADDTVVLFYQRQRS